MEQPASASSSQEKRSTDRSIDEDVRVHSRLVLLLVAGGRGGDSVHGSAACVSFLEEVEGRKNTWHSHRGYKSRMGRPMGLWEAL